MECSLLRRQLLSIPPWASFVTVIMIARRLRTRNIPSLQILPCLHSFTQEIQEQGKFTVIAAEEAKWNACL